jgi:hypothetical protein
MEDVGVPGPGIPRLRADAQRAARLPCHARRLGRIPGAAPHLATRHPPPAPRSHMHRGGPGRPLPGGAGPRRDGHRRARGRHRSASCPGGAGRAGRAPGDALDQDGPRPARDPQPGQGPVTGAEPVIVAVDLGTSVLKVALVAADGSIRGEARRAYPTEADPATHAAEQRPEDWWSALIEATAGSIDADVAAICVVGQGPTMVPVDERGRRPIRRSPGSTVDRPPRRPSSGGDRARRLEPRHPAGGPLARARSGRRGANPLVPQHVGGRDRGSPMWPATRAGSAVLPDRGRLAGTGLAVERLPPVVDTGVVVGGLTSFAATELGLAPGIPVVAGTNDAFASFLGAGLLSVATPSIRAGPAVAWPSGTGRSRCPARGSRRRHCRTAGRRRRDDNHRPRPRLAGRRRPRWRGGRDPPRRGGRHTAWLRWTRVPAVPRR